MTKIALLADYYPVYLRTFAESHELAHLPYARHQDALLDDAFGAWGSHRNWLRTIGNECEILIANDWGLQQKWLDERRIPLRAGPATKHEVVLRQLAEIRPDVFFAGSMFDYYGEFFRKAKQHVRRLVTWIACPYPESLDFSNVDCVVSSVDAFVARFRARGLRAAKLAAAFDQTISTRLHNVADDVDVSFVGALGGQAHRFRVGSLQRLLADGVPLKLWGYGLSRMQRLLPTRMSRAFQGEAWGMEMYRTLARSRITLNFHIDVAKTAGFAGNMRIYEATGCGTLLLTDTAPGIEQLFAPGREIETYASIGELEEKIRHYLDHPAEREAIARAGQEACLSRHGYSTRIHELERILIDAP